MKKKKGSATIVYMVWFATIVGGSIGWVLNVVKMFGALADPLTAMFIARVVGIFCAPLGAILGYL